MTKASELARTHWNETPLYLSEEFRYQAYPWLPEVAEFEKHSGHKILEIGCGTGSDLLQFAKNGAVAHGIDITDEHLRLAKRRVGDLADVEYGDGRDVPFHDNTFDYVYSHGVIHHSDEPQKIVHEILRVLKPGGRFNVHVYAKWSYFPVALMLRFGRSWRSHIENSPAPVHIDLYTAHELHKLFPVPIKITKHQCRPIESLAAVFGWYLVAKGRKSALPYASLEP